MHKLFLAIAIAFVTPIMALGQCACPECGNEVAVGLLKKGKDSVKVYSVKCEKIAVPDICMPRPLFNLKKQICNLFGKKCTPGAPCGDCEIKDCPKQVRQGKIRFIKVLKKETVECNKCSYKWEVTSVEKVDEYLYGPLEKKDKKEEAEETPEAPPLEPEVLDLSDNVAPVEPTEAKEGSTILVKPETEVLPPVELNSGSK